ncbi:MAG TPA: endolytic transglycosylase MltG [Dermatophilaceae bacterium]|nr:endolytic transglycosylase MltG [Dermatophilaceae bacterium]
MKDPLHSSIFGSQEVEEEGADVPGPAPRSRREARELERRSRGRKRSNKPSGLRRFAVLLMALLVLGGASYVAYKVLRPVVLEFLEPNDYPGPGTGEVRVTIEEGDSGAAIAKRLVEQDVVKSTKAYIEAASSNPRSSGIQPGVYELKKQMSAADAVAVLVDSGNRITNVVVIREGLWAKEVYAALSKHTGIPVAEYVKAAKDAKALGLPPSAKGNVEGYLFPASYTFDPETTATDHLKEMVANSVARLDKLGVAPERMEHVVIVASLVEAEARLEADRPKVARVVENRLAKKMMLQFDSTVNYAVGKHGITTTDAARALDNPYNTYKVVGLPAGPIGNPGESAIKAAAAPTAGPWLYFVTVNPTSGETRFTDSYEEHQANVKLFQQWCSQNKGQC